MRSPTEDPGSAGNPRSFGEPTGEGSGCLQVLSGLKVVVEQSKVSKKEENPLRVERASQLML